MIIARFPRRLKFCKPQLSCRCSRPAILEFSCSCERTRCSGLKIQGSKSHFYSGKYNLVFIAFHILQISHFFDRFGYTLEALRILLKYFNRASTSKIDSVAAMQLWCKPHSCKMSHLNRKTYISAFFVFK